MQKDRLFAAPISTDEMALLMTRSYESADLRDAPVPDLVIYLQATRRH